MNNFELNEQAQNMADTRSAYDLARELLQLQEQMANVVAAVKAIAAKPLNSYTKKVLRKKMVKLKRLRDDELECLECTKREMLPPQPVEMMDYLANVADAQSRVAIRLGKKISKLREALGDE